MSIFTPHWVHFPVGVTITHFGTLYVTLLAITLKTITIQAYLSIGSEYCVSVKQFHVCNLKVCGV